MCVGPDKTTHTTTKFTTPSPPPPTELGSSLSGVSCVSDTSCQAVGYYIDPNGRPETLIESWNGKYWTITPSPNGPTYNALKGVSCVSATFCKAVGYSNNGLDSLTFIESWTAPLGRSPQAPTTIRTTSSTECRASRPLRVRPWVAT